MVKFGTAQKQRLINTVIWEASPESGADITLLSINTRRWYLATCNPAEGMWFQHFTKGCNTCTGNVVRKDRAFT